MPKFDGTGPFGHGFGTGRKLGYCSGVLQSGLGRCFSRFYRLGTQVAKSEEKGILEKEVEILEEDLRVAKERLATLKI
jgi:hypothetical protein